MSSNCIRPHFCFKNNRKKKDFLVFDSETNGESLCDSDNDFVSKTKSD